MKKTLFLLPIIILFVMLLSVNVSCKKEKFTTLDTIKDRGVIDTSLLTKYDWEIFQNVLMDSQTGMYTVIDPFVLREEIYKFHFGADSSFNIYREKSKEVEVFWWFENVEYPSHINIFASNPEDNILFVQTYKIIKLTETGLILIDMNYWTVSSYNLDYFKKIPLTD